jgi:hypothetical protein
MNFDEWYANHWKYGSSTDRHGAQIAWLEAKDLNMVNLQDLEYICERAIPEFIAEEEPGWARRAEKYREKLHELTRDMPG